MRLRFGWLRHALFALGAIVILLCAAEVALKVYDARTGALTGTNRASQPEWVEASPLTHHRLRASIEIPVAHPDTAQPVVLRTNAYGLRGGEPAVPKPAGEFRIICLGDETTLGTEVAEEQTFSRLLQIKLQKSTHRRVIVLNAGVPGYCPLLSHLQVRHSLLKLEPDLLILNFDMSDVADDHRYRRHAIVDGHSVPVSCPHETTRNRGRHAAKRDKFLLMTWCRRQFMKLTASNRIADRTDIDAPCARYSWILDDAPNWSLYIRQALSPIAQLDSLARRHGAGLFVAVCPAPWQVSATACNEAEARSRAGIKPHTLCRSRSPFETLQGELLRHDIPFCDPSPVYSRVRRSELLYLKTAPRLSRHGHELYARVLAAFVARRVFNQPGDPRSYEQPGAEPTRDAMRIRP